MDQGETANVGDGKPVYNAGFAYINFLSAKTARKFLRKVDGRKCGDFFPEEDMSRGNVIVTEVRKKKSDKQSEKKITLDKIVRRNNVTMDASKFPCVGEGVFFFSY